MKSDNPNPATYDERHGQREPNPAKRNPNQAPRHDPGSARADSPEKPSQTDNLEAQSRTERSPKQENL
jgi:hypothetical protein